jgi:putative DNA primase/helicase
MSATLLDLAGKIIDRAEFVESLDGTAILADARKLTRLSSLDEVKAVLTRLAAAMLDPLEAGVIRKSLIEATGYRASDVDAALRQARKSRAKVVGPARTWMSQCIVTEDGTPLPILANAAIAFREDPDWRGILALNEFTGWITLRAPPPWHEGGAFVERPWTDADGRRATVWLQNAGILARSEIAFEAITTVAEETVFHPVRDYLDTLVWDGTPRLDDLLTTYAGVSVDEDEADETFGSKLAYIRAIGSRWMIGAVARIYQPGAKVDSALMLVGDQDLLKSRFFAILGGAWFTDQVPDLKSKDAAIQLAGVWIIEFAELTSFRSAETNTIKAFMTRQTDRYRAPYGRQAEDHHRQCAFAGTTNDEEYLQDPTGARRFWSARTVKRADIEALIRDRDQLWPEAVHRFKAGEKWWLHEEDLIRTAAEVADEHYAADPWEALIRDWVNGRDVTSVDEILDCAISKDADKWTKNDETRIGNIMRKRLKWTKRQSRSGITRGKFFYLRPGLFEERGSGWVELIKPTEIRPVEGNGRSEPDLYGPPY